MSVIEDYKIALDLDTIERLKDFLELQENLPFYIDYDFQQVWLRAENNKSELRLLTSMDMQLTVSRVAFTHKRQGTMTGVFNILKNFCKTNGIKKLVIQSVQTKEMECWCQKNGLLPDPYHSYCYNGCVFGNWDYLL